MDSETVLSGVIIAALALLAVGGYMLPTMIAGARDHRNLAAVFTLNLLLGWTGLGWCIALVWSFVR